MAHGKKRKRLGEVLREKGQITEEALATAIGQQNDSIHLGELLLQRGVVSRAHLAQALLEITHVPCVDLSTAARDPECIHLIPRSTAERCCAVPLAIEDRRLEIAMAQPQNLQFLDELRFTCEMEIAPRFAFRSEILKAIAEWYSLPSAIPIPTGSAQQEQAAPANNQEPEATEEMEFISASSSRRNTEAIKEIQDELTRKSSSAARLVSEIVSAAMKRQASDIHIEPMENDTIVRLRVDGILRDYIRVPPQHQHSLVSRIKILADMDIAERRQPQDGRVLVRMKDRRLDLRISTLPTQYGEKVVMRLLDPSATARSFADLGLPPDVESAMRRVLAQPQGMLLVTGPTGSGKSTTLYAALHVVRKPSVNIITVEDPVEYQLEGVNQVQVNTKAGLSFASVLRSILRQDPNVIMVGEIRDKETAEIAMKASQTGHLVLSTLHTNDSVAAITRLIDLGVPAYLVGSSVSAVMAQRLVRRLCVCRKIVPPGREFLDQLEELGAQETPASQAVPVGCEICDHTGYKGRIGIYEMLMLDAQIRAAIREEARSDEIRAIARSRGLKLMQEQALEFVCRGVTTVEEVKRVVPFEKLSFLACAACHRELLPSFAFCPYCGTTKAPPGKPAPAYASAGASVV